MIRLPSFDQIGFAALPWKVSRLRTWRSRSSTHTPRLSLPAVESAMRSPDGETCAWKNWPISLEALSIAPVSSSHSIWNTSVVLPPGVKARDPSLESANCTAPEATTVETSCRTSCGDPPTSSFSMSNGTAYSEPSRAKSRCPVGDQAARLEPSRTTLCSPLSRSMISILASS